MVRSKSDDLSMMLLRLVPFSTHPSSPPLVSHFFPEFAEVTSESETSERKKKRVCMSIKGRP